MSHKKSWHVSNPLSSVVSLCFCLDFTTSLVARHFRTLGSSLVRVRTNSDGRIHLQLANMQSPLFCKLTRANLLPPYRREANPVSLTKMLTSRLNLTLSKVPLSLESGWELLFLVDSDHPDVARVLLGGGGGRARAVVARTHAPARAARAQSRKRPFWCPCMHADGGGGREKLYEESSTSTYVTSFSLSLRRSQAQKLFLQCAFTDFSLWQHFLQLLGKQRRVKSLSLPLLPP